MSAGPLVQLRILSGEAVRDALRRRIVAAVAVLSLLSLMIVESCTSCATGGVTVNGEEVDLTNFLSFQGVGLFAVLALWTQVLAGLLAADHLTEPLADGSARLALARPVSRETYALARLFGSLAVSLGAGAVLLGGAGFFLVARYGLDPAPALYAGALCALGSVSVGGLSMAASLFIPRLIVFPAAFLWVWLTAGVNLASMAGAELSGLSHLLDRFGTPFLTATALALTPWSGRPPEADWLEVIARLVLWSLLAATLLIVAFRRQEL